MVVGFSSGDLITVTYTKETNSPDNPISFNPGLGTWQTSWQDNGLVLVVQVSSLLLTQSLAFVVNP